MHVNREREDLYLPSDHNQDLNGTSVYLLEHMNTLMPCNDTQRHVYLAQPCNVQAYPPQTYNDGRYGENMYEMQIAGYDWEHDQKYSAMTVYSTAVTNVEDDWGGSQNCSQITYHSEMTIAEDDSGCYKNSQRTMVDNTVENTLKGRDNSQNANDNKDYAKDNPDMTVVEVNLGGDQIDPDLVQSIGCNVLDDDIKKARRTVKKEKKAILQAQKATRAFRYAQSLDKQGISSETQVQLQRRLHAAKEAASLSLEIIASLRAIEAGIPMMHFNDWSTQSTRELCQALWEGRLSQTNFIQALIDILEVKYGNGVDTPEGPSFNCLYTAFLQCQQQQSGQLSEGRETAQ